MGSSQTRDHIHAPLLCKANLQPLGHQDSLVFPFYLSFSFFLLGGYIIAVENCVSLCWTMMWVSYLCTHTLPSWISSHPHPTPLDHHRAVSIPRVIWYPAIFQGWQMRCCILYFNSGDELDALCSTSFNPSLMFLIFWMLSFGLVGCASLKLVPEFFWLKTNRVCFLAVTHSLRCPNFWEWKMVSGNQIHRSFPFVKASTYAF